MSKLVICEKPSVAKSIASALGVTSRADGYFEGGGWLISWCIGHLVGLADAAAYDDRYKKWRYEDLPILPAPFHYVVSEEKADQFHILRSLMERPDVTELVNACDAGREGELIFRLVYEAAGCSKPFSRLWISSMEDAAIREGFADLHPGADYDPLYQSALCRQKADWLIGINASRLFSVLYLTLSGDEWEHERPRERQTEKKPSIKERLEQSRKECANQSKAQPHREKSAPEL